MDAISSSILGGVVLVFKVLIARHLWDIYGRAGDPLRY